MRKKKTIRFPNAKHRPNIIRSRSAEAKIRIIRQLAIKHHGPVEIVLEIGGHVKGNTIFVLDCLIPQARVGYGSFYVEDLALSQCWAEAEQCPHTRHLDPVADLHFHPGNGKPEASNIDEENSLRQASLYHVFNLETVNVRKEVAPNPVGLEDIHAIYDLDEYKKIRIPIEGKRQPLSDVLYDIKIQRSLWASLIYPSDADSNMVSASVVEHRYGRKGVAKIRRHEDVDTKVLDDEQVAEMLDWPLQKIRLRIDKHRLNVEVKEKYEPYQTYYSTYSSDVQAYGYHNYHAVGTWQNPHGYYPVVISGDNAQAVGPRNFRFLTEAAGRRQVADLLKEAVAILNNEPLEEYAYLSVLADEDDIATALRESARVLKKISWN